MKTAATLIRFLVAPLFLFAGVSKFGLDPNTGELFAQLGMEPGGRWLVGALEVLAAVLLAIRGSAATGALLGWGILCGALIAHATVLGVAGMMGAMSFLALAAWIGCGFILYAESRQIDCIRCMFAREKSSETSAGKDSSTRTDASSERP